MQKKKTEKQKQTNKNKTTTNKNNPESEYYHDLGQNIFRLTFKGTTKTSEFK